CILLDIALYLSLNRTKIMKEYSKNHSNQVEITDLIEESITVATHRRQQGVENSLIDASEAEIKNIEGGLAIPPIIILGYHPF
ncbi:MAG: hypothetical protein AAGF26_15770, partial [Cyanobacteria bacterium P01_G01_bin.49]